MRVQAGLRLRLVGLVAIGSVLALAVLALAFNLAFRAGLDNDAEKILRARATAALDSVVVDGGGLRVNERPQQGVPDTPIWVFDGATAIERAPGGGSVQRLADELSESAPGTRTDPETETRLLSVPVLDNGERVGTVVSALPFEPYERSESRALLFSLALVGLVCLLIVGIARLLVDRALRPVTEMTAAAAEWTEHDLSHRFNAGEPHDELTALAATFDGMLDRLANSLRHEQRFSAELSHELRTPLAAILAEAELALRRDRAVGEYQDALARIVARGRQLQRILETLLLAERAELSGERRLGATAEEIATRAIGANAELAEQRGLEVTWSGPEGGRRIEVEADLGERILSPLIENALRYARSSARVQAQDSAGSVSFLIDDDGPGVPASEREAIFEPGKQLAAGATLGSGGSGAGLGLSLSRRLARAVGGEVRALDGPEGARFEVVLPAGRML